MRARTVNFERQRDSYKGLKIGQHRQLKDGDKIILKTDLQYFHTTSTAALTWARSVNNPELPKGKYLITTDNCFLMVSLNESRRAVRDFQMEVKFENDRVSEEMVVNKMKALIEKYLFWQYENMKNEFYKYPKYLSEKFQPFQRFLV